ncbi:hypothetical protein F5B22DRAFT_46463 [Xylaria bambusicola]|uniref:uncharacterized protein n=1 Tax=Xylaria bambusicola TaxID=326684 RepID=UPI0020072DEE|nr:uncharacterized protein F5B22DRAFT_46463 [Xylaria bambusicola]KAI0502788.1 hypothetical protein F5B22DRAFT_46463 [Xylaria bambusicola]
MLLLLCCFIESQAGSPPFLHGMNKFLSLECWRQYKSPRFLRYPRALAQTDCRIADSAPLMITRTPHILCSCIHNLSFTMKSSRYLLRFQFSRFFLHVVHEGHRLIKATIYIQCLEQVGNKLASRPRDYYPSQRKGKDDIVG